MEGTGVPQSAPGRKPAPRATAPRRLWRCALLAAALALSAPAAHAETGFSAPVILPTPQIISSDIDPSTGYYSIINRITGAERFYLAGYYGQNTILANVEAGHVWNGHETTANVSSFISNAPINDSTLQFDYHATAVGFTMVGLGPPSIFGYFYYQFGMAPAAFLSSVAIATSWTGTTGEFNISTASYTYGYRTVMQDGIEIPLIPGISYTRTADVVNSSWGYADTAGIEQPTMVLDALTFARHQTVTVAAGNHETGQAPVGGPASGFNVIAVGALGDDTTQPPYQTVADFSNTGPIDFYNPQTLQTIPNARPGVAIVAPGSDLILPAYVGPTGTNTDGTLFDVSGVPAEDLDKLYFLGAAGTSFAAPIVAGGAALLVDAGYANYGGGVAVDGRVIKAVLLNSATKTPGWTNQSSLRSDGVLFTSMGLDTAVGAGALNLDRAYDQYLTSHYFVNFPRSLLVQTTGWAFSHITSDGPNNYLLNQPLHQGEILTVTADWFIPITFNTAATPDPDTDLLSEADLHATWFDQLNLQIWRYDDGRPSALVAECFSPYLNVNHLYYTIPEDGAYAIRVSYLGTTYDLFNSSTGQLDYAIAWSVSPPAPVPEPASLLILLSASLTILHRHRPHGTRVGVGARGRHTTRSSSRGAF